MGVLTWRERPQNHFPTLAACRKWNGRFSGMKAGYIGSGGYAYVTISIDGRPLYLGMHRIIWALVHGALPPGQIDHKNMDRTDNRIENLRAATSSENRRNSRFRSKNTSGFRGVSFHCQKWRATIVVNRHQTFLGYFATREAAHAAYCLAAKKLHGEFASSDLTAGALE
jgi:hypothetical protein